jgi:ParB-like nuclease family protein
VIAPRVDGPNALRSAMRRAYDHQVPPSTRSAGTRLRRVSPDHLYLDRQNPRLFESGGSQAELVSTIWRNFAVEEVAISIAANGYWDYEPLVATPQDGRLVVIEGNRRLAAVKLLLSEEERMRVGATDLPEISTERRTELATLPVIESSREDAWQYIGYKHVNGPQAWQSFSKAQYISWVHNELKVPLTKVAETIGDTHSTVQRLYRALMTLQQAERERLWNREDRHKQHFSFSHLYVGLNSYAGIQNFVGLDGPPADTSDPVPREKLPQLQELLVWLYGSRASDVSPVIQSQNPHLRQLDQVLQNENAIAALRGGLPLANALDVAKGDAAKLRENLISARRLLQDARGKVLTGYRGEQDLIEVADDILTLAESVVEDMRSSQRRRRRARVTES